MKDDKRRMAEIIQMIVFPCIVILICGGFKAIAVLALLLFACVAVGLERTGPSEEEQIEKDMLLQQMEEETRRRQESMQENVNLARDLKELTDRVEELQTENQSLIKQNEQNYSRLEEAAAQKREEVDPKLLLLPPAGPKTKLNLCEVIRSTVQQMSGYAAKAGIDIQVNIREDELMLRGDLKQIEILFRNIIDNSIKYMNRTGMLIITASMIDTDIFIILKDSGRGLSEQETEHIFELNYQGSNRISGNGLGLTQAKAIVQAYGGTVYAKSTVGNGMGIYIQIPVA